MLANTLLYKNIPESYLDNVLLVLEEVSSVLYFVHPCASSIQNGLYEIALVLYTPTESNVVSSLVVSLCCRLSVRCQHSRLSA